MARLWASGEKKDDIVKLSHKAVWNSSEALGRVWPHVVKREPGGNLAKWLLPASLWNINNRNIPSKQKERS